MTCIQSVCWFCLILKIPHWTEDSAPCLYILWQSLYRWFEPPLCPRFCVPVVFLLGRLALEKNSSWMIKGPYNKNMWVVLNCTPPAVAFPSAVARLRRSPHSPSSALAAINFQKFSFFPAALQSAWHFTHMTFRVLILIGQTSFFETSQWFWKKCCMVNHTCLAEVVYWLLWGLQSWRQGAIWEVLLQLTRGDVCIAGLRAH